MINTLLLCFYAEHSGILRRAQSSDYGQMYSFDGRVSAAVNARTGGLLQATTYVAGCKYCQRASLLRVS